MTITKMKGFAALLTCLLALGGVRSFAYSRGDQDEPAKSAKPEQAVPKARNKESDDLHEANRVLQGRLDELKRLSDKRGKELESLRVHLAALAQGEEPQAAPAGKPVAANGLPNPLVGSWKLAASMYNEQEFTIPAGMTVLKHITPTHYMQAMYDADGKVGRATGGDYTVKDDRYAEIPRYSTSDGFERMKDKTQVFTSKLDGNRWLYRGKLTNGMVIEEVWERVVKP